MKRFPALALAAFSHIVLAAKKSASALLQVTGSTQGVLIRAEVQRAFNLALASAGVVGGVSAFLTYLSTDTPFLIAIAPGIQVLLARAGLMAVPTPVILAGITFILARSAALALLIDQGKPAVKGFFPGPIVASPILIGPAEATFHQAIAAQARETIEIDPNGCLLDSIQETVCRCYPAATLDRSFHNDGRITMTVHPFGDQSAIAYDVHATAARITTALADLPCSARARIAKGA